MSDQAQALAVLRKVIDADVGVNIVDLGLVEKVEAAEGLVDVELIMTTPSCPQSSYLRDEATRMLTGHFGKDTQIRVRVLDQPFWGPERLSPAARSVLGWLG